MRVVLLTEQEIADLVERSAEAVARRLLAQVLPPYSQTCLPAGVSKRAFLTACAAGCPHRAEGRTRFVERSDWARWGERHRPSRAPHPIEVSAHPPPANGLDPHVLLDIATRSRQTRKT
jgi:hypothetical protein